MTAHELARVLLEGPDLPIAVEDGGDPSDISILRQVKPPVECEVTSEYGLPQLGLYIVLD